MIKIALCDYCENFIELKDGWKRTCNAFPEGIPCEYCGSFKECNKDYKYTEKKDIPPRIKKNLYSIFKE